MSNEGIQPVARWGFGATASLKRESKRKEKSQASRARVRVTAIRREGICFARAGCTFGSFAYLATSPSASLRELLSIDLRWTCVRLVMFARKHPTQRSALADLL